MKGLSAEPGERFERTGLRTRVVHPCDIRRDRAQLVDIGDRPVTQIDLGDPHVIVALTGERLHDARVRRIALTPSGRALVDRVVEQHFANEERLLATFSDLERTRLTHLLTQWARALGA